MESDAKLLTLAEVHDHLRVSMVSIYAWIRSGKLPAIRVGREWRVRQSDLNDWLDARKVGAA